MNTKSNTTLDNGIADVENQTKDDSNSPNAATSSVVSGALDDPSSSAITKVDDQSDRIPTISANHQVEHSSSYFSLSSASSAASSPEIDSGTIPTSTSNDNNKTVIDKSNPGLGNVNTEALGTIESFAKRSSGRQRQDSDDSSYSKIKPVHNFFGQHQFSPYDSDGSDGSLVFSPGSVADDQKIASISLDRKEHHSSTTASGAGLGSAGNKSTTSASNRNRFSSVDSLASNGSIRYVRSEASENVEAKQATASTQPINPQMLPYNERRKLMQQRQYEEQHQQLQYHAAMMQQAHSQAQHQQGHPSHPSSVQPYAMDPRMIAGYYQMYGMPPPGMYAPMPPNHAQHQSGGSAQAIGYPFPPPPPQQPGAPQYYPNIPPNANIQHASSQPQLHSSVQQFQHHTSTTGYQQQPYPSASMPSPQGPPHFPSPYNHPNNIPPGAHPYPQFAYLPPAPSLSNNPPPDQLRQEQQPLYQEPLKPPQQPRSGSQPALDRSRSDNTKEIGINPANIGVPVGPNSAQSSTSSAPNNKNNNNNARTNNPPRLPPAAGSRRNSNGSSGHRRRSFGSSSSIPPPPPPPPPMNYASASGSSSYHSRADSFGSMSSLGSHGLEGTGFRKDEQEDDQARHLSQSSKSLTENTLDPTPQHEPMSSTTLAPRPTIDTSIGTTTPETPREAAHARKNSFLDMLRMNWSPQSRNSPSSTLRKQPNINDFHRKNQEFLNRATTGLPPFVKTPAATATTTTTTTTMSHRRVGSQDRPPASRGTHRRLPSISNDEWDDDGDDKSSELEERDTKKKKPLANSNSNQEERKKNPTNLNTLRPQDESDEMSDSFTLTDEDRTTTDEDVHDKRDYDDEHVNEFSALLPPSGISTNEHDGKNSKHDRRSRRGRQNYESTSGSRRNDASHIPSGITSASDSSARISDVSSSTARWDNRVANAARKSRKKKYRNKNYKNASNSDSSSESSQNSSDSSFDHRKWTKKRARMLEKERAKLIEQWKAEAREEAEMLRKEEESNKWHRRLWRSMSERMHEFGIAAFRCLTLIEKFVGNLPLTIGAVALAIVTLGVVWFKFAEEYLDTCEPVHFHSSQCTFPEFPGCFYCDKSALGYKIAIGFHYMCTIMSGMLAMLLVAKILLATRVVMDEMSSPTTSSPAGLLCMTAVCVFAGRGMVGQVIVSTAACFHLALAIWFIYMALAYNIMPEPSWFPNTIGIGLSAVKTWLYYPMPGHLLMAISLSLNFFFFPISLIRVAVNKKISATVAWMQMSAPAVSLYALTIMAQPSFEEEQPDVTNFQRVHRMVYLPCMHVMCALSLLGMAASLHSLYDRWSDFKRKEFSPAHAAFCFPTLSHANSIQAYRGAVRSFSQIPPRSWRMFLLDGYWFIVLVGGTIATIWICGKFLYKLPEWTSPDLSNEEEPPAPYDTLLSQQHMVTAGDTLTQNFVSPAILQANETGALILSRSARDGTLRYVRTRRIRALGFEPTMNWSEIQEEEEKLLEWVGKHPPRRRHRTLSVPGIDFSYGSQPFGTGNSGVYSSYSPIPSSGPGRRRSMSQGQHSTFFK